MVDEVILYNLLEMEKEMKVSRSIDFDKTNYTSDNEIYEYESEYSEKSSSTFIMLSDIEILQVYSDKNFVYDTFYTTNRTIIDNKKCEICVLVRNVYFKRYL